LSEVKTGLRGLLSRPSLYEALQWLLNADRRRREFVDTYVRPAKGERVLDVGCGPAELLRYMPGVTYFGFDPNPAYIERAKRTFGNRGSFFAKHYEPSDVASLPPFDLVILSAVLHHLDDDDRTRRATTRRERAMMVCIPAPSCSRCCRRVLP
jgi:SAM-dependent methyltransferase